MKKIRNKFLIFFIIILSCLLMMTDYTIETSKSTASNNTNIKNRIEELKQKGVLTVASSNERPFSYIDPQSGKFTGIDADIITEAAKRLGINKVEMKLSPFKYIIEDLYNKKNIDIIANGLYVTDERKNEVLFTNIWYKEPEALLLLNSSPFDSRESLINAVIGAQSGTIFLNLAQKWKENGSVKEVRIYQSQPELILGVATNEVDAAVLDSATVAYILPRYKNIPFTTLTSYKTELPGFIAGAVRKEDTDLADALNLKVNEMKQDGTLLSILKKYGLNESNFVPIENEQLSNK